MKFLRYLRDFSIFLLQLLGAVAISGGLRMIYPPVSVIYCGVVMIWFGHRIYSASISEESDK